jgi:dye decolorizing peroxidase
MSIGRRSFFGLSGAALVGASIGAQQAEIAANRDQDNFIRSSFIPPWGEHQAGIEHRQSSFTNLLGFKLKRASTKSQFIGWLRIITGDIEALAFGKPVLADPQPELAEGSAKTTVTVGIGSGLLTKLGLAAHTPAGFIDLPAFKIDQLDAAYGAADVFIQVGSDDAMVQAHAVRCILRDTVSLADLAWNQPGFTNSASSDSSAPKMRNLMGHIDGTDNPAYGTESFTNIVWLDQSAGAFEGGTQLAVRRIEMNLEKWDSLGSLSKELVIGRKLENGAPLTGKLETDPPDLMAKNEQGFPTIPQYAHIRRAAGTDMNQQFFRRPFNYQQLGPNGEPKSGLLFMAYARNLELQFLPVQQSLADFDLLNMWTTPVGSATFVILPGFKKGQLLGERLIS